MARRSGEEDCGTHPRGTPGAHPAGGGSGRPDVAAAVVLADAPDSAEPGAGTGERTGRRSGIPRGSAAARAAASHAGRAGAGRRRGRCHRGSSAAQHLPGGADQGTGVKITEEQIGRVINISCRAQVGTGGNILIAGFVVGGQGTSGSEQLLIRGSGPALVPFGVSGALPDPQLQLFSGSTSQGTNN